MFRTRWVLATLLAACLLGACSDDDPKPNVADPTASASSSATTTNSPTPSSTESALSPRDTVDAWLAAWTKAMQTGDTEPVKDLSKDSCASCARLIAKVEEVYGEGGRYETDGWSATRVNEAPDSVRSTPSYVMQVVQGRRALYDADGKPVDTAPPTTQPMRMTFDQVDGSWLLARLEILE